MKVASMPDECVIRRSGDCQFPVSTERNVINRCKCGQFTDNEFCRMIAGICKSYKRMAPQVGLEPTTLRLTAGEYASRLLILKGFATDGRHPNRHSLRVLLGVLLGTL